MPRSLDVARRTAALVLAGSVVFGCATPSPPKPAKPTTAPIPAPVPPPPTATPRPPVAPATPAPPLSIGPRPETVERPERELGPAPPALPTAPPVAPGQRGKFVVLNFDNADIETVIHAASEIVGFNYVLSNDVRGKVTVQTSGRVAQEDVFGVLLAILEVNGFTAVKSGTLYKIVRIEGARERAVPTIVGTQPDPSRTTDEVITQIIALRYSSAADVSNLIRPLISTRGALIAHRETNILLITDTAANIARLLDIVRLVDVQVALEELAIIPIRFADAADLSSILNQLFTTGRLRAVTPGAIPGAVAPTPAPVPVPAQPGAAAPRPPGTTDTTTGERPPLIVAERRSNSLIIYARRHELEAIRRLIAQLDVNIYGGRRVFIYYAENAKSKDLAATLNAIYGGRETTPTTTPTPPSTPRPPGSPAAPAPPPSTFAGGPVGGAPTTGTGLIGEAGLVEGQVRFIADETTNAIIVTTFPRNWPEIESTIKQLDRMPRQVLIEVLVAEITLKDSVSLGLDWAFRSGKFSVANLTGATQSISGSGSPTLQAPANQFLGRSSVFGPLPAGFTAWSFATDKFFAMLNTLASENLVNIVSTPHVLTSENKKAVINVSNSVPILTAQQAPIGGTIGTTAGTTPTIVGTQTVEYRDAGVVLTVTPRIGERGTVALDVKQEVNDIAETTVGVTTSPTIIKREAETSVVLVNNQTLVLGGMIQQKRTTGDTGIPLLKNIPVLGYLFSTKTQSINKTELIILITPRVIGTALDAARLTDEMRSATPELNDALRRAPRPPSSTMPPELPAPTAPSPVLPAPAVPAPAPSAPPGPGGALTPPPTTPAPPSSTPAPPTIAPAPPVVVPAPPVTAPVPPPTAPVPPPPPAGTR